MSSVQKVIGQDLYNRLSDAAELTKTEPFVRVVAHYDGDGTSAAIIMLKTLMRLKKRVHLTYIKSLLGEDFRNVVLEYPDSLTIVVDAGSDQAQYVPELEKLIILDHHFYKASPSKAMNINARDFGIDGTRGACGSTMAMIFSLVCSEQNSDLIPYFVSGMIADKQDLGGISGLNKLLLDEYSNLFSNERSISLEGETLLDSLVYSTDPFFNGITGKPDGAKKVLDDCHLGYDQSPMSMNEDQKRMLEKKLAAHLISQKCGLEAIKYLESDMMKFKDLDFTSKELSSIIDGNARVGKNSVAVQYFLGDSTLKGEMLAAWRTYKTKLIDYVYRTVKEIGSMSHLQYFYSPESEMAGKISDLLMLYLVDQSKPIIGFNVGDKNTKLSGRGTIKLVKKGLNLSTILKSACDQVGGSGGGHDVAAGGVIPKGKEKEFVELVNKILKEQGKPDSDPDAVKPR